MHVKNKPKRPIVAVLNDWGTVHDIFETLGAYVLDVEYSDEVEDAVAAADAVVFTGGGDINPERYGWDSSDRHPRCYGITDSRDAVEFAAFDAARKARIPVLGICRGAQLINVGHGGTLHQDIFDGAPASLLPHSNTDHAVKMRRRSRIGQALKDAVLRDVTSLHHQAVDRLGNGLIPVGWAPDGTVEMIETAPGVRPYMLGTQFHPEMDITSSAAQYDAWVIFETIFDLAKQHSISRGGDYWARYGTVAHLLVGAKYRARQAILFSSSSSTKSQSKRSVDAYMHDVYADDARWPLSPDPLDPEDEEDSYEAWNLKMSAFSRSKLSDIERADTMCVLNTGCMCPLDCLAFGDCAADCTQQQTIKEVINEMTKEGKRGSKR